MKIIIPGGSGFIGNYLAQYFADKGNDVIIFARKQHPSSNHIQYIRWDAKTIGPWAAALEAADVVINLTGKSVNCRYTKKNKKEILDSRIDATNILGVAIAQCAQPPAVWINVASATIYRHAEDHAQDEFTGETGSDFSMNVCKAWEKSFEDIALYHTRKIILRLAIVLGKKAGVMGPMKNLVKFGLGGKMGNGKQMMSWIHEEDVARILEFMIANENIFGIYNVSSPNPVTNKEFMSQLRKAQHRSFGIPSPAWLLTAGAILIGTETELILKSRWVIPQKLVNAGYKFKYPQINEAFHNLLEP